MRRQIALWLAVVAIVAVTFPWDLRDHAHWQKVAWVPFASGIVRVRDLAGNLALYAPLGYLLSGLGGRRRTVLAVVTALSLSLALEASQVWSHVRFPSATDVLMNVIGAAVGATLSWQRTRTDEGSRVAA
jgi:glycopeptide antibiotics resistance protein